MKDIVIKSSTPSPLHWDHPALDAICQQLPDFGSLLLVAASDVDFTFLWDLITTSVVPNAITSGISAEAITWSADLRASVVTRLMHEAIDGAFVAAPGLYDQKLHRLCTEIADWPCAVILLAQELPQQALEDFDVTLVFENGQLSVRTLNREHDRTLPCVLADTLAFFPVHTPAAPAPGLAPALKQAPKPLVATRNATGAIQTSGKASEQSKGNVPVGRAPGDKLSAVKPPIVNPAPSKLAVVNVAPPSPSTEGDFIAVVGVSRELVALLDESLKAFGVGTVRLEAVQASGELARLRSKPMTGTPLPGTLQRSGNLVCLVLNGSWSDPEVRQAVSAQADTTAVVLIALHPLRAEDRIAAYREGVKLVLPADASIEEKHAAILAHVPAKGSSKLDPFRALDADFVRISQRLRRQTMWNATELERAQEYYQPFVVNQIQRASLEGIAVGALVVPLPTGAPQVPGFQPLASLFQRTLIGSTLATLRQRDLGFIYADRLVVVSHQMNALTARAILRRVGALLSELNMGQEVKAKIVRARPVKKAESAIEAARFLKQLFAMSVDKV